MSGSRTMTAVLSPAGASLRQNYASTIGQYMHESAKWTVEKGPQTLGIVELSWFTMVPNRVGTRWTENPRLGPDLIVKLENTPAADLRLQQNRYALWKRVSLANRIAETGRATLITSCVISSMPRSL